MVKIQAGHYYDTGYMICKAEAIADKPGQFFLGCHYIDESGRIVNGEQIVKREVYVSQVAPVPAITPAPGKWVLDNGEVVELKCAKWTYDCIQATLPLAGDYRESHFYVASDGRCFHRDHSTPFARLSHPYVEKTPVERLKSLKERVGHLLHGEIDGIIAAMEKA